MLTRLLTRLISACKTEPAVLMYAASAALTALVAFGVHATPAQAGAITTITAGVITVVTAVAGRPVVVPAVTGAVATIASAAAAFGLHLTAAQIGTALPAATMILALVLRQAITPVATLNAAKKAAAAPAPH
jgi:hypothetical protein